MRVKRGVASHKRHKKLLEKTKGYKYGRSRTVRRAKQAVMQAGLHAYRGRKLKKRTFRSLWIARLSGALAPYDFKYSLFIAALKKKNIGLDRKVLSNLAIEEPGVFKKIVEMARS